MSTGSVLTPDEFVDAVRRNHVENDGDIEVRHSVDDDLMEYTLTLLGYGEGVALIGEVTRWYA